MKMRSAALLIALCAASLLSAPMAARAQKEVIVQQAQADPNIYGYRPLAYREIIERWMKQRLDHPNNAKFEFPSPPQPGQYTTEAGERLVGYIVEFAVTARNELGGYTKEEYRAVIFAGNVLWIGHAVPLRK